VYATLLLKQVERIIRRVNIGWNNLSTNLISKFCYILLKRVIGHDLYTGGDPLIYRIDNSGIKNLIPADMFPRSSASSELIASPELVGAILDEFGSERMLQILRRYLGDDFLRKAKVLCQPRGMPT